MKLRKFNDFKRIYENNPGLLMEPGQEELMSGTEVIPGQSTTKPKIPVKPEKPVRKTDPNKIEQPNVDPQRKADFDDEDFIYASGTQVSPNQPQTAPPTVPVKPEKPVRKTDPDKIEQPSVDPQRKASYEEEEALEGDPDKMLQDLAEITDSPLVDGKIDYNGQVVEFQSEPMCFAINGKTMKQLKTSEQVADYLMSNKSQIPGSSAQKFAQGSNQRRSVQSQMQIPHQVTTEKKHYHSHKKRFR